MKLELERYRDFAPLARGACVDVFSAVTDRGGARIEACVKRFRVGGSELAHLFLRASEAASSVRGPNVVAFLDYGTTDEGWTFVVERVRGAKLRALVDAHVARRVPVPFEIIVHVGIEVARAIASGARAGLGGIPSPVSHRGLSPSSIRVSDRGAIVVGEFAMGTVFPLVSEIRRRVEAGFADYLSPEHLATQVSDARQDLYSLGAVLYELSTGRPPRRGVVATRPDDGSSPHLGEARADLPREFTSLVEALLEREGSRRIGDADFVIGSLFKLPVTRVHEHALLAWRDALVSSSVPPAHSSQSFAAVPIPIPTTTSGSGPVITPALVGATTPRPDSARPKPDSSRPKPASARRGDKPVPPPTASSLVGLFTAGVVAGFAVAVAVAVMMHRL